MRKRQAKQGSKRQRSTQTVRENRSAVKAFEQDLVPEIRAARRRLGVIAFDLWAARKMARMMALTASLAQRKARGRA